MESQMYIYNSIQEYLPTRYRIYFFVKCIILKNHFESKKKKLSTIQWADTCKDQSATSLVHYKTIIDAKKPNNSIDSFNNFPLHILTIKFMFFFSVYSSHLIFLHFYPIKYHASIFIHYFSLYFQIICKITQNQLIQ